MAKKDKQQTIYITPAKTNCVKIDLRLKTIQEDACRNLLLRMYREVSGLQKGNIVYNIGTFILGIGITEIVDWFSNYDKDSQVTLLQIWNAIKIYSYFVITGLVIIGGWYLFQNINSKKNEIKIIDSYMNSDEWTMVSNPSSLTLDKIS